MAEGKNKGGYNVGFDFNLNPCASLFIGLFILPPIALLIWFVM